jgi:hypothetical protein
MWCDGDLDLSKLREPEEPSRTAPAEGLVGTGVVEVTVEVR